MCLNASSNSPVLLAGFCTMSDRGWHESSEGERGDPGGVRDAPPSSSAPPLPPETSSSPFWQSIRCCCCMCSLLLIRKILGMLIVSLVHLSISHHLLLVDFFLFFTACIRHLKCLLPVLSTKELTLSVENEHQLSCTSTCYCCSTNSFVPLTCNPPEIT